MKAVVYGGAGEHGRSCYYIENEGFSILFDCGGKKELGGVYPPLDEQLAAKLDAVFLSHAHEDHSMALPLLYKLGFRGEVWTSRATVAQLPAYFASWARYVERSGGELPYGTCDVERIRYRYLDESAEALEWFTVRPGIRVRWGASGHMVGSVWLQLIVGQKRVFFSGDYCAEPVLLRRDEPRGWGECGSDRESCDGGAAGADSECSDGGACGGRLAADEEHVGMLAANEEYGDQATSDEGFCDRVAADLAIVDAAYGPDTADQAELIAAIVDKVDQVLRRGGHVLMPVPLYGRGQDLLILLRERLPEAQIAVEPEVAAGLQELRKWLRWLQPDASARLDAVAAGWLGQRAAIPAGGEERLAVLRSGMPHVILTADGMLQSDIARWYYAQLRDDPRHAVVFTGHLSQDSYGASLQTVGSGSDMCEVVHCRYKVHQGALDVEKMLGLLPATHTILAHAPKGKTDQLRGRLADAGYGEVYSLLPGDCLEI